MWSFQQPLRRGYGWREMRSLLLACMVMYPAEWAGLCDLQ